MSQESFDNNITDEMGKENIEDGISRRCIDEKIRNPNCGMRPQWMNWHKAKDEIEIKLNLILMPGLVIYITILFWFARTQTTKVKQSN